MDLNTAFSDFWTLLDNCEDYAKGGYRSDHGPAPEFRFHLPQTAAPGAETPSAPAEAGSLEERIAHCRRCDLHLARKAPIPGRGAENPDLLVVLSPPGYDEDDAGEPLLGERREYLSKWIGAVGLNDDQVYLTNMVKCRAPGARAPLHGELMSCRAHLIDQINEKAPKAILLLGEEVLTAFADQLPGEFRGGDPWRSFRGRPFTFQDRFTLATFDPADVLRDQQRLKREVWEDLKLLKDYLARG